MFARALAWAPMQSIFIVHVYCMDPCLHRIISVSISYFFCLRFSFAPRRHHPWWWWSPPSSSSLSLYSSNNSLNNISKRECAIAFKEGKELDFLRFLAMGGSLRVLIHAFCCMYYVCYVWYVYYVCVAWRNIRVRATLLKFGRPLQAIRK